MTQIKSESSKMKLILSMAVTI